MEEAPAIDLETYQLDEDEEIDLLTGLVELDTDSITTATSDIELTIPATEEFEIEMPTGPPPTFETEDSIEHEEGCNGLVCSCGHK